MRILVIGGRGFLGAHLMAALREIPGAEVTMGSRQKTPESVQIDLHSPATFGAMDAFEVIVNAADTLMAPPDAALDYAIQKGKLFLETSADSACLERLIQLRQQGSPVGPGAAVIGLGLFPGMSNLLAKALFTLMERCERLDVAIRARPLSGAGEGTCALMAYEMGVPAISYVQGRRVEGPALGPERKLPFLSGEHPALQIGLPEPLMLHASVGVPNSAAYYAPHPAWLRLNFRALGALFVGPPPLKRAYTALLRSSLRLVRSRLLRAKPTFVELTVLGYPTLETEEPETYPVWFSDGFVAAGYMVAAVVAQWAERDPLPPGIYLPDELFTLDATVERMRKLAKSRLIIAFTATREAL